MSKSTLCAVCENYDTDGGEFFVKENETICPNCDVDECACHNCDCPDWLPDIPKEILFAVETDEDQATIAKVNGIAMKKKRKKSKIDTDEATDVVKFPWSDDEEEIKVAVDDNAKVIDEKEGLDPPAKPETEKAVTDPIKLVAAKSTEDSSDDEATVPDVIKNILSSEAKTGEIAPKTESKIDTKEVVKDLKNKGNDTDVTAVSKDPSKQEAKNESGKEVVIGVKDKGKDTEVAAVTKDPSKEDAKTESAKAVETVKVENTPASEEKSVQAAVLTTSSVDPISDHIAPAHEKLLPYYRTTHLYTEVVMPSKTKENITVPQAEDSYKKWKCGSKSQLITLMPTGDLGKREYAIIKREMENTRKHHFSGKFSGYSIIKIQKIVNPCLWRRYRTAKKILSDTFEPNERMLFHGSPKWDIVIHQGFDEKYAKLSGMFGAGIYFTSVSSKSNQYTLGPQECVPHKAKNCFICERHMILCRVLLGKTASFTTAHHIATAPEGYHSVKGEVTTFGLQYDEYIVYKKEQVYPEYLVTYTLR